MAISIKFPYNFVPNLRFFFLTGRKKGPVSEVESLIIGHQISGWCSVKENPGRKK